MRISKWIGFILLALSATVFFVPLVSVARSAEAPPEIRRMQEQLLSPTIRLNGNCSGQLVFSRRDARSGDVETLVLTAKHCVADQKTDTTQSVEMTIYDDGLSADRIVIYPGDVIGRSASDDIALIRLRDKTTLFESLAAFERGSARLYVGEDVVAVGHPKALAITITRGTLGPIERSTVSGSERDYLRSSAPIVGGSSGGGLYHRDDAGNYRLIGIATAGYRDANFITYFTPIAAIEAYLKVAAPQMAAGSP